LTLVFDDEELALLARANVAQASTTTTLWFNAASAALDCYVRKYSDLHYAMYAQAKQHADAKNCRYQSPIELTAYTSDFAWYSQHVNPGDRFLSEVLAAVAIMATAYDKFNVVMLDQPTQPSYNCRLRGQVYQMHHNTFRFLDALVRLRPCLENGRRWYALALTMAESRIHWRMNRPDPDIRLYDVNNRYSADEPLGYLKTGVMPPDHA
jgi:hypothetical protein